MAPSERCGVSGVQSKDGWTCLHLALQREHKELSELFILVGGEELVKIQVDLSVG